MSILPRLLSGIQLLLLGPERPWTSTAHAPVLLQPNEDRQLLRTEHVADLHLEQMVEKVRELSVSW